ncbi:MAG: hypothetical protein AAGI53_11095 [Planctomycetota bacterium]
MLIGTYTIRRPYSVALFGKKKVDGDADKSGDGDKASGGFSPEKAKVFFDRAQTLHESTNYAYAVTLWLNGLAQDPSSEDGFRGFVDSVTTLLENGKPNAKEISKSLQGVGKIHKYQIALLNWGVRRSDPAVALKAAEAASGLGLQQQTELLGRAAMNLAVGKPKKDFFVKLLDVFAAAGAFELALEAGQAAKKLDPSDGPLDARLKEMMAQSAIRRGGFEENSGAGGFRNNIRDLDKQTLLENQDAIVKTEDVKERLVNDAMAAYEANPNDLPSIDRYGKALLDRAAKGDERRAMTLFSKAFKDTGQFRYRQRAGEVKIRLIRNSVRQIQRKVEAAPDNDELKNKLALYQRELVGTEVEELQAQVEAYPTDLGIKFELGKRYFAQDKFEEAIELFQVAQHDAKNRIAVMNIMGQSFLKLGGWEDAAIDTFRGALGEMPDQNSDLGMELRYYLMCSLSDKASSARDLDAAEEADKLAAGIAIQKFNYRDIRDRREAVKGLIAELKAG